MKLPKYQRNLIRFVFSLMSKLNENEKFPFNWLVICRSLSFVLIKFSKVFGTNPKFRMEFVTKMCLFTFGLLAYCVLWSIVLHYMRHADAVPCHCSQPTITVLHILMIAWTGQWEGELKTFSFLYFFLVSRGNFKFTLVPTEKETSYFDC